MLPVSSAIIASATSAEPPARKFTVLGSLIFSILPSIVTCLISFVSSFIFIVIFSLCYVLINIKFYHSNFQLFLIHLGIYQSSKIKRLYTEFYSLVLQRRSRVAWSNAQDSRLN